MGKRPHYKILRIFEKGLNKLKLREKILVLFVFSVMVPLACTDGIILSRILKEERAEDQAVAENMAESVASMLMLNVDNCEKIATSVRQNYNVGEMLGTQYENPYDYFDQYHKMTKNFFFQTLVRFDNVKIKLYTSNKTVVSGGYVGRIDSISDVKWYKDFVDSGKNRQFLCTYDDTKGYSEAKRSIYFIEKLTFPNNDYDNFIRIEIDYSSMVRTLETLGHARTIYVCEDDIVLMSNKGKNNLQAQYDKLNSDENIAYIKDIDISGNISKIVVMEDGKSFGDIIKNNRLLIIGLLLVSILLPLFVIYELDYSIVYRIKKLDTVFGKVVNDELVSVDNPEGDDEIGNLMVNYNKMVSEANRLIQIVYKDRLREQEANIAKKNAELLALHSQINPHFMFNALESIRMHSVIKGEAETAEMVEKLAMMERQYVDWGSDMIKISQEISSVEAYLGLQKYRFGDKLMYELNVDESCSDKLIPKLTIVTFVENACVHGMENKNSECWVFVRVYSEDDELIIEVEDTGNGIADEIVEDIRNKAKTIEIDDLKSMHHVGIFNALLRLKMTMGEKYKFDIESEEGIGTMIQITIPVNRA